MPRVRRRTQYSDVIRRTYIRVRHSIFRIFCYTLYNIDIVHCILLLLHTLPFSLFTMTSQMSSRRRGNWCRNYFPGDPRYASCTLKAPAEEFAKLATSEYLCGNVLDCILQSTALPIQDIGNEAIIPPMIGSLGSMGFITARNDKASVTTKDVDTDLHWKNCCDDITKLRIKLSSFINNNATPSHPQRLIIPVVDDPMITGGHFFVACFDFCVHHPDFFVAITIYDSLERKGTRIRSKDFAADIVKKINFFFNTFILHNFKVSLRQSDTDLLRLAQYEGCPRQLNGHDCGIFAVVTVLHLVERIELTPTSFTQADVTKARSLLAKTLRSDVFLLRSSLFRDCFPLLRGRNVVDAMGVEVIHNHLLCESNRRKTRSTNALLLEGLGNSAVNAIDLCWQDDIVLEEPPKAPPRNAGNKRRAGVANDEKVAVNAAKKRGANNATAKDEKANANAAKKRGVKNATAKDKKANANAAKKRGTNNNTTAKDEKTNANAAKNEGSTSDDTNQKDDVLLYRILHNSKVDSFEDLLDVAPFIEEYETLSGNRLRIQQSVIDKFRLYRCCSHVQCPFRLRFSRKGRVDGRFVLSSTNPKHSTVPQSNRAVDGRKLKKRRQGEMLDEIITRVQKTKDGLPVPADVIKTATNT